MTKRWRHWLSAAVIFGVVAILAMVAVPCENLSIAVANDSRERASIRITVRQNFATPSRLVWTGTAKAGETRKIALIVEAGYYTLHVVAQFPDHRGLNFWDEFDGESNYLFGSRTYDLRMVGESLRSDEGPPESFFGREPNYVWAPVIVANVPRGVLICQDYGLRQDFRRWMADLPFRSKSGGGSG